MASLLLWLECFASFRRAAPRCATPRCYATWFYATWFYTTQFCATPCCATPCFATPCFSMVCFLLFIAACLLVCVLLRFSACFLFSLCYLLCVAFRLVLAFVGLFLLARRRYVASWCWAAGVCGWHPGLLSLLFLTFCLGTGKWVSIDKMVLAAEAEEQEGRKRRGRGDFSFSYLSGWDECSCADSGIPTYTCRQNKTRKNVDLQ